MKPKENPRQDPDPKPHEGPEAADAAAVPPPDDRPGFIGLDLKELARSFTSHITIDPGLPPSANYRCGERIGEIAKAQNLSREERARLTETCYELPPGGECVLTIEFVADGKPAKPKGLLLLQAERGRLEAVRVELDGHRDHVKIRYRAPDETIKVSVRVGLEGFRRGKIHLHLEPPQQFKPK